MKKLLLLLLSASYFANGQAVQDWSQYLFGPNELVYGPTALNNTITTDAAGNVYAIGVFASTTGSNAVDLDPGPGVFNLNVTSGNIYITKTDALGNFIWAKQIGGSGPGFAGEITLDSTGNIYITGKVGYGFWDFNPSPTVNVLTYVSSLQSNFIEKLDANGTLIWVKLINNDYSESYDQIDDINVDASGNVYTTGSFRLNTDFDPGTPLYNLATVSDGFKHIFVLKLDASGNFVWAKAFKGTVDNYDGVAGHSLKSDSNGNVYVSGYFSGVTDFDPNAGVLNKTSVNGLSLFVTKLDLAGNLVWVNTYEKIGTAVFESKLVLDSANNPIVFDTTQDIQGGQSSKLYKLNSADGTAIWTKVISGVTVVVGPNGLTNTGGSTANCINLDSLGNIYLSGQFIGTVDFDPGVGVFTMVPSGSLTSMIANFDGFFVKLDVNGNFVYANQVGGTGADYVSSVVVSPSGKLIIRGKAGTGGFTRSTNATVEGGFMASYSQPALGSSQNELDTLSLYPNPTNGNLNIQLSNTINNGTLKVITITGQMVFEQHNLNGTTFNFDVTSLNQGVYIVQLISGNEVFNSKFIKQ